jgi:hypothetical protein
LIRQTRPSYFEKEIGRLIISFVDKKSKSSPELIAVVQGKVVDRHYHTFFSWEGNNANSFFAMFGDDFKLRANAAVKADAAMAESIRAFLQLGNLRNLLVHENYALFPVDTSSLDIFQLYTRAKIFLAFVEAQLGAA